VEKRQRAGAVQDASRSCESQVNAPASWSAAALRRFCIEQARSPAARNVAGNGEIRLPVQDGPDFGGG